MAAHVSAYLCIWRHLSVFFELFKENGINKFISPLRYQDHNMYLWKWRLFFAILNQNPLPYHSLRKVFRSSSLELPPIYIAYISAMLSWEVCKLRWGHSNFMWKKRSFFSYIYLLKNYTIGFNWHMINPSVWKWGWKKWSSFFAWNKCPSLFCWHKLQNRECTLSSGRQTNK